MNDSVEPEQTTLFDQTAPVKPLQPQGDAPALPDRSAKQILYSRGDSLPRTRPLDRIRRPAPSQDDGSDLSDLIKDLNFGLDDLKADESKKEQAQTTKPVPEEPPMASGAEVPSPIKARKLTRSQPVALAEATTNAPKSRRLSIFNIFLLMVVVGASMGAGYLLSSYLPPTHSAAPSAVNNQTEAEWQKAQAQWECTLRQYQAKQQPASNNKSKEITCAN